MKKLIFILCMVPLFITAQSVFQITPKNGKVISNLDMSSFPDLDTAILFQFPTDKEALVEGWSFQLKWIDLDTTGYAHDTIAFVRLNISNMSKIDFMPYTDSLQVMINDTTGLSGFEDDMWNWKYGELEIELLDTISSGSLSGEFYFKPK